MLLLKRETIRYCASFKWMSSATCSSALLVLLALITLHFNSHAGSMGAIVAPNEQVGYKACTHLMLRLVDCLIDACDLYLSKPSNNNNNNNNMNAPGAGGDSSPLAAGAIRQEPNGGALIINNRTSTTLAAFGGNGKKINSKLDGAMNKNWPLDESGEKWLTSTKPMKLFPDEPMLTTTPTFGLGGRGGKQTSELTTSGCWPKAIKWVRVQLAELKSSLIKRQQQKEKSNALADALTKLAFINRYLNETCGSLLNQKHALMEQQRAGYIDSLSFIIETLQVLAEMEVEARSKLAKSKGKPIDDKQQQQLDDDVALSDKQQDELYILVGAAPKAMNKKKPASGSGNKNEMGVAGGINEQATDLMLMDNKDEQDVGSQAELVATETIKQHYAYLTQIVTTYNLLFNSIDADLMGDERTLNNNNNKMKKIANSGKNSTRDAAGSALSAPANKGLLFARR